MGLTADTAGLAPVPRPIPVGPEMAALDRFFPDVTWTGRIVPGGMGPGTPGMTARGEGQEQFLADTCGHAGVMQGRVDGDRLLFGTPGTDEAALRLTWNAAEPGVITWRSEASPDGVRWRMIEASANGPGCTGLIWGRNIRQRSHTESLRFVERIQEILTKYPAPATGRHIRCDAPTADKERPTPSGAPLVAPGLRHG